MFRMSKEPQTDFDLYLKAKEKENGVQKSNVYQSSIFGMEDMKEDLLAADLPTIKKLLEKRQGSILEIVRSSVFELPEEPVACWEDNFHAFMNPNDSKYQEYFTRWSERQIKKEFNGSSFRNKKSLKADKIHAPHKRESKGREEFFALAESSTKIIVKKHIFSNSQPLRKTQGKKRTRRAYFRQCSCCGREIQRHNCKHTLCQKPCEHEEKSKIYKEKYKSNYPRIHRIRQTENQREDRMSFKGCF